jgi:hypothetical protein
MRMADKEMAPAVRQHPGARPIRENLMDSTSVAYVLCRIEDDSSLTPISDHEDIVAGVAAGKHQVGVEDFDFSYGLYVDGGRVASFAGGRMGYREWARRNGRLADIHSLDDRLDHDIDELMAALHLNCL